MGHYSKASEKQPLTGSALHRCRTPKARMFALFSKDMEILCDNINYSQSQWRGSLFHIYRAHQFSAVSRVTGKKFSSKRWTWAIIQRHLKNHSWPEVRCTVVVPQRPGCVRYLAKIWGYCVTTLIIHNHSDGAVYFHIYRAHQFSAVSRVTGRHLSSKRWTWAIIQRDLKNHP